MAADRRRPVRLAHLSDPHVALDDGSLAVFTFLVNDAVERGADHVLITGDVVDRPDAETFGEVRRVLRDAGMFSPEHVTVLPGNHDASGRPGDGHRPADRRRLRARFLRAFERVNRPVPDRGLPLAPGRPIRKRLGALDLLAFSTASDHHDVEGRVLDADLEALASAWRRPSRAIRVVALHHHPDALGVGFHPRFGRVVPEGLVGGERLLEAAAAAGARFVLHGHIHESGGVWDRTRRGLRLRCQGTARGRTGPDGRPRFGYDLYRVSLSGVSRRRRFATVREVVEGLLIE